MSECEPQQCYGKPKERKPGFVTGEIDLPAGKIPIVATELSLSDKIGWLKVRWAFGRESFSVKPGLYATGSPTPESPVFVTANYKMSFDYLRVALHGRDAWILILDTLGINVWCAAGKKTFGTDEVIKRVKEAKLDEIVSHRVLILPQLGASGVAGHIVRKQVKFRVKFGPVRSSDIPAYIDADMTTTPAMRKILFKWTDRILLVPVELVISAKYVLPAIAAVVALSALKSFSFTSSDFRITSMMSAAILMSGWLTGSIIGPLFLSILPGRSFSMKGAGAGIIVIAALIPAGATSNMTLPLRMVMLLLIPSIASFLTMNFTGASTYASPSGVRKEMKIAVPLQVVSALAGIGIWIAHLFI